jgi:hypothetical protein
LNPPEEKSPAGANPTPKLYLICDARDVSAVEPLEEYLFERGLEVCLPDFDGSVADAEALHQQNLLACDAVLVYAADDQQHRLHCQQQQSEPPPMCADEAS